MNTISINLLPAENAVIKHQIQHKKLIQVSSILIILGLFFLTSLSFTLRFLQDRNVSKLQEEASASEAKISKFHDRESTLVFLKDRLSQIDKLTSNPSKQKKIYDLVIAGMPPSINVSSFSLDSSSNITISATAPNQAALAGLFTQLTSDQTLQAISQIEVESLSRGQDSTYRATLKLTAKQ